MLTDCLVIIGWSLMAGLAMPFGAATAVFLAGMIRPERLRTEIRHYVMAFGGGALMAAISLVLVPDGTAVLGPLSAGLCFSAGGLVFMGLDVWMASRRTQASQLMAMLSDFLPETLALGTQLGTHDERGPLLACLIALQNVPEGFNAFCELASTSKYRPRQIIGAFTAMACLGPVVGLMGYFWLMPHPTAVAGIMLFAAGGILYIVFQDIAPQVPLEHRWGPPLGAVAGFLVGMVGNMLIG